MLKEIYNEEGTKYIRGEQATPVCGVDFCDNCGDCLACYGEFECHDASSHQWVQYGEN